MPVYEVEAGGSTFEVEAPSLIRAESAARLMVARQRTVKQAEEGAVARSAGSENERFLTALRASQAAGGGGGATVVRPEDMPEGAKAKLGLAATIATVPTIPMTLANPLVAAKMGALSLAGGAAGGMAGRAVGSGLEAAGLPEGTSKVTGAVGGLVGSIAGPMGGPGLLLKTAGMTPGKGGVVASALERLLGRTSPEAAATLTETAKRRLELEVRRIATREQAVEIARRRLALAEAKAADAAARGARVASAATKRPVAVKATTTPAASSVVVPATTGVPVTAAPEETIILKLQQQMKTAAGRREVREYLQTLPKNTASQIRMLLARGQAHPATAAVGGTRSASSMPTARERGLGEELARMLGQ